MIVELTCSHCKTENRRARVTELTRIRCVKCNAIAGYDREQQEWIWHSLPEKLRKAALDFRTKIAEIADELIPNDPGNVDKGVG